MPLSNASLSVQLHVPQTFVILSMKLKNTVVVFHPNLDLAPRVLVALANKKESIRILIYLATISLSHVAFALFQI